MKVSLASDLHLEFMTKLKAKEFRREPIANWKNTDNTDILLLAGDILVPNGLTYQSFVADVFFENITKEWEHIYYIPGNHEYYHGVFPDYNKQLQEYLKNFGVHFMELQTVDFGVNYQLIGASLWTDMDDQNPVTMRQAQFGINDYSCIKYSGGDILTPAMTVQYHIASRDYVFRRVRLGAKNGKKSIVMSHHGPTFASIAPEFQGDPLNGAYCSDLSKQILENTESIPLWVHGHMHHKTHYFVDQTQVICHARGYYNYEFWQDNYKPRTIILD